MPAPGGERLNSGAPLSLGPDFISELVCLQEHGSTVKVWDKQCTTMADCVHGRIVHHQTGAWASFALMRQRTQTAEKCWPWGWATWLQRGHLSRQPGRLRPLGRRCGYVGASAVQPPGLQVCCLIAGDLQTAVVRVESCCVLPRQVASRYL